MPMRPPSAAAVILVIVAVLTLLNPLQLHPVTAIAQGECFRVVDHKLDRGAYGWAEAYAAGTICIPSDGNVHDPEYWSRGGASGAPYIVLGDSGYVERGCRGDYVYAYAIVYVDPDRDGTYLLDAYAFAMVAAGPCGST